MLQIVSHLLLAPKRILNIDNRYIWPLPSVYICSFTNKAEVEKHLTNNPSLFKPKQVSNFNCNNIKLPKPDYLARTVLPLIPKSVPKLFGGLAKIEDWISLDASYIDFILMRGNLLKSNGENIIQCKTISYPACREAFRYILGYILIKYPYVFELIERDDKVYLCNRITKGKYRIDNFATTNPNRLLKILCHSIQEDINIIGLDKDHYRLIATLTTCPVGWDPKKRIGETIVELHRNAPGWEMGEGKYAKNITSAISNRICGDILVKRANLFIFNTNKFFLLEYNPAVPTYKDIGNKPGFRFSDLHLRREYQSFVRLPETSTILFTVKTYIEPMINLSLPELLEIQKLVSGWGPSEINYHKSSSWLPVLNRYIQERNI